MKKSVNNRKLHPDEVRKAVIHYLTNKHCRNDDYLHQHLRLFLRNDNGTLAGKLLYLSSMLNRAESITALRTGFPHPISIDFSFSQESMLINIYTVKLCFIYLPPELNDIQEKGSGVNILLHIL